MEVLVDPRVEWNQMYHEVWRIERDFLYDPNHHGVNIPGMEKKYAAYLKGVGGRTDRDANLKGALRQSMTMRTACGVYSRCCQTVYTPWGSVIALCS